MQFVGLILQLNGRDERHRRRRRRYRRSVFAEFRANGSCAIQNVCRIAVLNIVKTIDVP